MDTVGPVPTPHEVDSRHGASLRQPVFYYDLGDSDCYLVAERIMGELPLVPEWEPVHGRQLGLTPPRPDAEALSLRIAELGFLPLRLPVQWPPESEMAMLTATFAKGGGRAVAFSLAAFRQAFAAGRDLGDEATVLIAAAACEMHPTAVRKGIGLRTVAVSLRAAGERALAAGVDALPAIEVEDDVFAGAQALELAIDALGATRGRGA